MGDAKKERNHCRPDAKRLAHGYTTPKETLMKPLKRSFNIAGHKTSISLEAPFWDALREAAATERIPLARLVARIDEGRGESNLSSAVRVWLLAWVRRTAVAPAGQSQA